jgi:hypothetical protein
MVLTIRGYDPCSTAIEVICGGVALRLLCLGRLATYLHDQHSADHGVFGYRSRWAMTSTDQMIRWSTALAVLGVVLIAAVVSYEHASALVRAHGETGWTARLIPLTVDGLIYTSSMVMLDSARRGLHVPMLARCLLALGIAATLAANVVHGLGMA